MPFEPTLQEVLESEQVSPYKLSGKDAIPLEIAKYVQTLHEIFKLIWWAGLLSHS